MEDNKPSYEEVKNELNEYKELLWQLSDEYKENVAIAEKKAEEELNKRLLVEKELTNGKIAGDSIYINSLGLPACILDNDGNIVSFNNKFKFLIELLFLDVEETNSIQKLLEKGRNKNLTKGFSGYLNGDKSLYQSIYSIENSFQGIINLILRIYRNENNEEHLAIFVELHKQELESLNISEFAEKTNASNKEQKELPPEKNAENQILTDIKSYVQRYEISLQLLSFINKKINDKKENINLIRDIYNKIEKVFGLNKEGKDLLIRLETEYSTFLNNLKKEYNTLTANEEKQCMLIKAGLTYKEIAALMEISVNGVKIARNRLRKKLKLDSATKTGDFIMNI